MSDLNEWPEGLVKDRPIIGREPIDWRALSAQTPPERKWALKGWVGYGHSTLLVGAGGIGKTLIAQQLASCLAIGRSFIGEETVPTRVLMWACEDDHDELWRRQVSISHWLKTPIDGFAENLVVVPRHGLDNTLLSSEFGKPQVTPLLTKYLREQAHDTGASVVVLDNIAQIFGGGENDRYAVTMFLNQLSGCLPRMAIILLGHPSRGIGSEFSGSSAWENAVRTRLYLGLKLPDMKADDEPADGDNVRFLARRKANYSDKDWRKFNYTDGVLVPEDIDPSGGIVAEIRERAAEKAIMNGLRRLKELNLSGTDGATSPRFLPRVLVDYKLSEGHSTRDLTDAMRRLIMDGKIKRDVVGRNDNRTALYGLVLVGE